MREQRLAETSSFAAKPPGSQSSVQPDLAPVSLAASARPAFARMQPPVGALLRRGVATAQMAAANSRSRWLWKQAWWNYPASRQDQVSATNRADLTAFPFPSGATPAP